MRAERETSRTAGEMKVADLRAQFRAASQPAQPVKGAPVKKPSRNNGDQSRSRPKNGHEGHKDRRDERMDRAERLLQAQHRTSLLSKAPKNNRANEYVEKKKSGLLVQLLLVFVVAGGVTVALDPSLREKVQRIDWQGMKMQAELFMQDMLN